MRHFTPLAVLVLLALPGTGAQAADAVPPGNVVPRGSEVVLGRYAEVLLDAGGACRALRRPAVLITRAPRTGMLVLRRTVAATGQAPCPTLQAPVTEVVYQAGRQTGTDHVAWRVRYQSREGGVQNYSATLATE